MTDVTPTRNRVLLRALPESAADTMVGSLHLPPSQIDRQRYRQWEIAATGPDVIEPALLPGLRVIINTRAGAPLDLGEPYLVVNEGDIVAWIDE